MEYLPDDPNEEDQKTKEKTEKKLKEFREYIVDKGVVLMFVKVLLSLKYAEKKPRNPIKVIREYFGKYHDPRWDEMSALKEKIILFNNENAKLLEKAMKLEDELKNLQRTKRIDKLFDTFELDKNGLISTKLIMELLTGNKKYDVDEKFDKEGLIKFIESVAEMHSEEEKILLDIYNNMLYPPPIGKYSKNLNFDSSLNMNSLIPITIKNDKVMLGEGAFSKVQLYQHKTSKIKYAVKKMNLIQLEKLSQNKKFVLNEVSIQGRINHPNIIKLYNFYEIKKNCVLILEYASKGTLFDLINAKNGLSESIAFYYFIQTLNAIYFLHLHSIIHRDLKPENLLINENNILKLCDFGWSVKLKSDKRTTFCGTVEYMAPEIIKKQQYDETIDIWSLGVLLYELVHSYSPFYSEDCDYLKIGNNIIQSEFRFKEGLFEDYKDLIQKILIKDSEQRIKIEEIYQHPFITKHINTIYREINSFNNTYNNTLLNYNNLNRELNGKTAIKDLKNKSLVKYINTEYNNMEINKKAGDIIYNKKKAYFSPKNSPKCHNTKELNNDYKIKYKNYDNSRQQEKDFDNNTNTDTNYMFESIPTEPEPKILPYSKNCKEIKKVNNNLYIKKNNNQSPNNKKGEINQLLLSTSRNKKQINSIKKEQKIKNLFKNKSQNQNKISHVKSFSLEQKSFRVFNPLSISKYLLPLK